MYVIIVYDVNVERVNKVKSFLRQYLFWIQNSVFEGELTKSEFKKVTDGLMEIIDKESDSVIIYKKVIIIDGQVRFLNIILGIFEKHDERFAIVLYGL